METPKKRNHQRKVGILRLIRRDKTIRISLPKCVKWKVICKGCGSQTPGMNLRFGPGIKLKILSKAEPCEMPDTVPDLEADLQELSESETGDEYEDGPVVQGNGMPKSEQFKMPEGGEGKPQD
ncbi:X antigen family member 1-like [Callithrix jacchus]|uniref:X antigen family member 1-like isoform X1 n=1 Tax=Callithrix jacchus TaxID=9483 RepID=UPI00159EEC49|nr:X antigen family member 1-like isoform X1 [Callithrix jacchus]XP_035144760.1 X antigen family member 1-like isoform X1 [Callithrix jacchus]